MKVSCFLVLLCSLLATNAFSKVQVFENQFAEDKIKDDPYFEISEIKISEVPENDQATNLKVTGAGTGDLIPNKPPIPPQVKFDLGSTILIVDQLIAIGKKVAPIIRDGAAVITNNSMNSISVLPKLEGKNLEMYQMSGWSVPKSKSYKIVYVNGFGMEVVSFVYSVAFQSNGSFEGKGRYLTGVKASARNITVAWGFDLSASSELIQISNLGSKDNAIAGATLEMSYTVKNVLKTIISNQSFHVTGDGRFYRLD